MPCPTVPLEQLEPYSVAPKERQNSCPYANILGVPGTGVHSVRLGGLAVFDTLATILLSIAFSYMFSISLCKSLLFWFILGEVLHYVFGTQTAFLSMIGLRPSC